jgi:hypothetical protein
MASVPTEGKPIAMMRRVMYVRSRSRPACMDEGGSGGQGGCVCVDLTQIVISNSVGLTKKRRHAPSPFRREKQAIKHI